MVPLDCQLLQLPLSDVVELADELGLPSVEDALKFPEGGVYVSFNSCSRLSDISAHCASNCASAFVMVVTCLSIGSSDAVTSTLYLSKAFSSSS